MRCCPYHWCRYPLEKPAEEGQEAAGAATGGSKGRKASGRGKKSAKGSS